MRTLFILSSTLLILIACSTTGQFRIPAETTLKIAERPAELDATGKWQTDPFFWSEAKGMNYQVINKNGTIARSGKLKPRFRAVSIFWPPLAFIYWPFGFAAEEYDFTKPGDGRLVIDDVSSKPLEPASAPTVMAAPEAPAAPERLPAKKSKKP